MPSLETAKVKLSIIIPCFNCEHTLREAVESCYQQGLSNDEFEIVMVDDTSTDKTRLVMQKLASEHDNIKLFYHSTNRGGGATRNTATENSSADLVFCLDSDDMLSTHTLYKMVALQKETNADGIGIETSIKFKGTDVNNIAFTNIFGYRNQLIPLESLLQRNGIMCPLYSTFLYTKNAFHKIGGYPTEHGFDTQGFAWRFLAAGLKAYTCPDTVYLHRIDFHESYYLHEYKAGRANINWKKILLEQNAILSDEAYSFIKNFNEKNFEADIIGELRRIPHVFSDTPKLRKIDMKTDVAQSAIPRKSAMGFVYRLHSKCKKILSSLFASIRRYISFTQSHIKSGESFYALVTWHILRFKKFLRIDFDTQVNKKEEIVDLFLPTIAKDFVTLQTVIESAQKHLQYTIGKIYIVTRVSDEMKEFCNSHGYVLVDETSVLGYGKDKIHYKVEGLDRSGWLFQQLLKFAGDTVVETDNFISIDSDTVLISPHSFIENNKFIFRQNEEWHAPYFVAFKNMFGYRACTWFSYTSHMMMFNKKMLTEMKLELEEKHGKPWDQVYMSTANPDEVSCVSDYDTYANWVRCNYPNRVRSTILYNRTLPRTGLDTLAELEKQYSKKYHSVSFHSYASKM